MSSSNPHPSAHEGRQRRRSQILSERVRPPDGPAKLAAFGELPPHMQAGAWLARRREVERRREQEAKG